MRFSGWVLVVGLVAGSSACGTSRARSPSGWVEVRTKHFVVNTDLDEAAAWNTARTLEETRAALLAVAWPEAKDPPGHTEFMVFARRGQLGSFLPTSASGVAARNPSFPPLIMYSPGGAQGIPDIVAHELAHDLSSWFMPVQPFWLSEGLASYLQTVRYDRGQASMGIIPDAFLHPRYRPAFPTELLSATSVPEQPEENFAFYRGAWLLTQYLLNQHGARFGKFQIALGRLVDWRTAWSEQFRDVEDRFDDDLAEAARRLKYAVVTTTVRPEAFEATSRPLSKAAVHGLFALASRVKGSKDGQTLRTEIEAALRGDPDEISALGASFYGLPLSMEARAELARKAVAAHPESVLAWLMAADAAAGPEARSQAIAAAIRADPFSPGARARSALNKIALGQAKAALADTSLAIRLGAPNVKIFRAHSIALAANGRCEDALSVQMNRGLGVTGALLSTSRYELSQEELDCAQTAGARPRAP